MKKFIVVLFIINFCFFNCISQNNNQDNIFFNSVINYKEWLLKNKIIQSNDSNVWALHIYKSNLSKNNFKFLLSFTVIKIKPLIFKGYLV